MSNFTKKQIYRRLCKLLKRYKTYSRQKCEFNFYSLYALKMAYLEAGWDILGIYYVQEVISEYEYTKLMNIWTNLFSKYNLTLAEND